MLRWKSTNLKRGKFPSKYCGTTRGGMHQVINNSECRTIFGEPHQKIHTNTIFEVLSNVND
jgi:hypothetical protein